MIEYIYFVKCPNCGDEHFSFFDEAKEYALGRLSQQPIITQVEVNRNDFGECTDSCDLGTVWSWEEMMKDTDEDPAISIFTKDDLVTCDTCDTYDPDCDPEFANLDNSLDFSIDKIPDNFRKPIIEAAEDTQAELIDSVEAADRKLIKLVYDQLTGPIADRVGSSGFYSENGRRYMVIPVSANSDSYDFESYKKDLKQVFPNTDIYCMMDDSEIILDVTNFYDRSKSIPESLVENSKTLGYYGEEIFRMLDSLSNDKVYDFLNEYGWYDLFGAAADGIGDIYTNITNWLDKNSGYALYSDLCKYDGLEEACLTRKSVPANMTIESLVEEMEENEDTVECKWCEELFDKSECHYEVGLGYLCPRCEAATKSRGETLTFREDNNTKNTSSSSGDVEVGQDGVVEITFGDMKMPDGDLFVYKNTVNILGDCLVEYVTDEDISELSSATNIKHFNNYDEIEKYDLENNKTLYEWTKFINNNFAELVNRHKEEFLIEVRKHWVESEYEEALAAAEDDDYDDYDDLWF